MARKLGRMDPVTLAVPDNRLRAIVEEMGEAMLRTVLPLPGGAARMDGRGWLMAALP